MPKITMPSMPTCYPSAGVRPIESPQALKTRFEKGPMDWTAKKAKHESEAAAQTLK
jgi:hypothetical protein